MTPSIKSNASFSKINAPACGAALHSLATGAAVAAALLGATGFAAAACSTGLPLQSSAVPALPGRAVYQGSDGLGANTQLYLFDFSTNTQTQISVASWNVTTPINAQFSPDGERIVFTAVSNNRRDVYVWKIGASAPANLTVAMAGATKSEDPKWSADGKQIVFKQDGNIKLMTIAFDASGNPSVQSVTSITTNGANGAATEAWAPFLSPDNKYVYFTRNIGSASQVNVIALATGAETLFSANGNYAYYPSVRDFTTIFYAGWTQATGRNDQILVQAPSLNGALVEQPALNDCSADNSDPAAVDSDYIVYSSDSGSISSAHVYRPVLGALASAQVWDLGRLGLGSGIAGQILGISYSAAR
jgi:Tol biopolymer transport system component